MSVNIKIENAQKRYGDNIIIGINDIDKMEKDIWNTANNLAKVSYNVIGNGDIYKIKIDDKNIIRAISSEEFSSFIMNFMNIENRSKKLNFLYEIIWNYAEKENKIQTSLIGPAEIINYFEKGGGL